MSRPSFFAPSTSWPSAARAVCVAKSENSRPRVRLKRFIRYNPPKATRNTSSCHSKPVGEESLTNRESTRELSETVCRIPSKKNQILRAVQDDGENALSLCFVRSFFRLETDLREPPRLGGDTLHNLVLRAATVIAAEGDVGGFFLKFVRQGSFHQERGSAGLERFDQILSFSGREEINPKQGRVNVFCARVDRFRLVKRHREGIGDDHFEIRILLHGALRRMDVIATIQQHFTGT